MGDKTGVQKRLRNLFPRVIFTQCVAHKGALVVKNSTGDENDPVEVYLSLLASIYNVIVNASTRAEYLDEAQRKYNEPLLRPLSLSDTRWLSASEASSRLERIVLSVIDTINTFKHDSDEIMQIDKKLSSFDFIALVHIMPRVLGICSSLSTTFQAQDLMIGEIRGHINDFKSALRQFSSERDGTIGLENWKASFAKDLKYSNGRIVWKRGNVEYKLSTKARSLAEAMEGVQCLVSDFVDNILDNTDKYFPTDVLNITSAFSVLTPTGLPDTNDEKAWESGDKMLQVLMDHYGSETMELVPAHEAQLSPGAPVQVYWPFTRSGAGCET